MPPDNQRDYEVGYRKPPGHTRFKKGQSGNPKGRPAGAKNLSTLLSEALNEPVVVTENGGQRQITKRAAIIKQPTHQAATSQCLAPPTHLPTRLPPYRPTANAANNHT